MDAAAVPGVTRNAGTSTLFLISAPRVCVRAWD